METARAHGRRRRRGEWAGGAVLQAGGGGAHLDLLLDVALLELQHPRLEPLEEVDPGVDQRAGADKRHRRLRAADRLRLGPVRLQVVELLLELAARGERLGEDEVGVLEPLGERARRPGAEVLLDVEHAVGRRLLRRRRFRRDAHALRAGGGGGALGGAVGHQPTGDGRARRQQMLVLRAARERAPRRAEHHQCRRDARAELQRKIRALIGRARGHRRARRRARRDRVQGRLQEGHEEQRQRDRDHRGSAELGREVANVGGVRDDPARAPRVAPPRVLGRICGPARALPIVCHPPCARVACDARRSSARRAPTPQCCAAVEPTCDAL